MKSLAKIRWIFRFKFFHSKIRAGTGLALLFMFFYQELSAQITIEREDFNISLTDISFIYSRSFRSDTLSEFTIPERGENLVWDYSDTSLDGIDGKIFYPDTSLDFPSSKLRSPMQRRYMPLIEYKLPSDEYLILSEDGFGIVGHKTFQLAFNLAIVTGNISDELEFLESVQLYDQTEYSIKFPLEYGSAWSTEIQYTADFLLTVTAFGLTKVPGQAIVTYNQTDSVLGWGTLRLNDTELDEIREFEVLLVKQVGVFPLPGLFLGGGPAPQALLNALGVEPDFQLTETKYSFWSKGYNQPVFEIEAVDSTTIIRAPLYFMD